MNEKDNPIPSLAPLPFNLGLVRAIPYLITAAAILVVGLVFLSPKPPATPPPAAAYPTYQIAEIGGCQFLVFTNPLVILHWPRCNATNHTAR
jgi:hypothetical protein